MKEMSVFDDPSASPFVVGTSITDFALTGGAGLLESATGEGEEEEGKWRENQRCLCVSTQMALLVPMDVNVNMQKGSKL